MAGQKPLSPDEVATTMLDWLKEHDGWLKQREFAEDLRAKTGDLYVSDNALGNPSIDPDVLRRFRNLTERTVVWVQGQQAWRWRQAGDPPSRQVD